MRVRGKCLGDPLLLMPPGSTQSSLPPTLGSSSPGLPAGVHRTKQVTHKEKVGTLGIDACCCCQVVQGDAETVCRAQEIRGKNSQSRMSTKTTYEVMHLTSLNTEQGAHHWRARPQHPNSATISRMPDDSLPPLDTLVRISPPFAGSWFPSQPNTPDASTGPPNTFRKRRRVSVREASHGSTRTQTSGKASSRNQQRRDPQQRH